MSVSANPGILTIVQKGTFKSNGNVLTLVLGGGTEVYTVIKTHRTETKINDCMPCKLYISFFNKQTENSNKDTIIKSSNVDLSQTFDLLKQLQPYICCRG